MSRIPSKVVLGVVGFVVGYVLTPGERIMHAGAEGLPPWDEEKTSIRDPAILVDVPSFGGEASEVLDGFKTQVPQLTPIYNPQGEVLLPLEALELLEFGVGTVGDSFRFSSGVLAAYHLKTSQQEVLQRLVDEMIGQLRDEEMKLVSVESFAPDEMVVSVERGAWDGIAWDKVLETGRKVVGTRIAEDLLRRIRKQIELEYPTSGRKIAVKLVGEKDIWVRGMTKRSKWQTNSIPKSLSHLVRVAEDAGRK